MPIRYYAQERPQIDIFREKYDFLSNYFPASLTIQGISFCNAEAAYQASKCANPEDRLQFAQLAGNDAWKLGSCVSVRKGWKNIRIDVMREVQFAKYTQNPMLAKYLIETGDKPLIHGNIHGDTFWGADSRTGEGENHLGKILMELRAEFRENGVPDLRIESPVREYGPIHHMLLTDGDITQMDVDCIVNAANSTLLGGGGVDGAIHRAAGPELLEECRTLNGCKTGEAKITKGYHLKAKHIIHTVGPIYGRDNEALLETCYRSCMELAARHGIRTIAFPAISTGVFRFPKDKAARIAVHAIQSWTMAHPENAIDVIFAYPDRENYEVMHEVLSQMS